MPDFFEVLWGHLLPSLPYLFAYMAGILATVLCWWRSRRAASFALAGLVVLLIGHVVGTFMTAWIIHKTHMDGDAAEIGSRLLVVGFFRGLVYMAGMALLLVAIFVDRAPRPSSDGEF